MTEMNRSLASTLRIETEAALQEVASKHGLSVKIVGGTFSESSLVQKVEFAVINKDGVVLNRTMDDLLSNLWRFDMTKDDLNKTYSHPMLVSGRKFKVIGYRTRARKNPITIQMLDNDNQYVIPIDSLRRCLKDSVAA